MKQENITNEDIWTRFKNFVSKCQSTYTQIQFKIEEGEEKSTRKKLNYNTALNLIRILQEALTNAIKHSGCTFVLISQYKSGEHYRYKITDNGSGFSPEKMEQKNYGNGLQNMKQRAKESGLQLTIEPGEIKGTSVTVRV